MEPGVLSDCKGVDPTVLANRPFLGKVGHNLKLVVQCGQSTEDVNNVLGFEDAGRERGVKGFEVPQEGTQGLRI